MIKVTNSTSGFDTAFGLRFGPGLGVSLGTAIGIGLGFLSLINGPSPALAQACGCACAQPTVGYLASNGSCICPCITVTTPALTVDTLTGPAGPAKQAVSWEAPDWGTDPDFAGFGWGGWGGWPGDFY